VALRAAVIGAGIVGASVAFRLAGRGAARVWIVDKSGPGSGTTSASFAWVNANDKTPRDYFELNHAGLEEHLQLRDELPDEAPWLHSGGNLEWAEDKEALKALINRVERLRSWGYATEWRKARHVNELLEPNVAFPSPDTPVAFFPKEAWVDAPQLAHAFVGLARQKGVETRFGVAVKEIETDGGRVSALLLRGGERLPVDAVVNAAGPKADKVAALLGRTLPLRAKEGLLVRLSVEENVIGRLVHTPQVNLRPDGTERIVVHHSSVDQKLEDDGVSEDSLCQELLERARRVVPALEGAKVEDVRVGVRPIPEDGLPCVGAVPDLPGYYETVTHSGVTLGPLLGRLLTREILDGEVAGLISPFRPARFARNRVSP